MSGSGAPLRWHQRLGPRLFLLIGASFVAATLLDLGLGELSSKLFFYDAAYSPTALCPDGYDEIEAYLQRVRTTIVDPDADDGIDAERYEEESIAAPGFLFLTDADGSIRAPNRSCVPAFLGDRMEVPAEQCARVFERQTDGEIWRGFHLPMPETGGALVFTELLVYAPSSSTAITDFLPRPSDVATLFDSDSTISARGAAGERVGRFISLLLYASVVLGITLVLHRAFLRPLVRLTRQASQSVATRGPIPVEFEARGSGEVAALNDHLNTLRNKVNSLVERLESTDAKRRLWIAQVSHDLRTPLTALHACLDRLHRDLRDDDPLDAQSLRGTLESAQLDLERVMTMNRNLLDIARLEHEGDLVLDEVLPLELVRRTRQAMLPLAQEHAIELDTAIDADTAPIRADGERLARALENLLRNAIQHARSRVRLEAERGVDRIFFRVRDDGSGFQVDSHEPLDLLKIQPSRGDDSNGLGLRVVHRVAEAHGGSAAASNLREGGAIVWISIPVATPT